MAQTKERRQVSFTLCFKRNFEMNILDFQKIGVDEALKPCLEEYLGQLKIVDFVYHYTSQQTLSGILDTREIWLSHALDMNDPSEILFGIDVIINILADTLNTNSQVLEFVREEYESMQDFKRFISVHPVFIFSLTEKNDDLKQWVHYGNDSSGISIEFVRQRFDETISKKVEKAYLALLMPVNYAYFGSKKLIPGQSDNFKKMISDIFKKIEDILKDHDWETDINFKRNVFDYIVYFASFIKQKLYAEEKEWRLVVKTGIGDEAISVKVISDIAQMKYIIKLDSESIARVTHSIIIGPKNHNNLTNQKALELLTLRKLGNMQIRIRKSNGEIR